MDLSYAKIVLERAKDAFQSSADLTYQQLLTPKIESLEREIQAKERSDSPSSDLSEDLIALVVDLETSI